MNKLLSSDEIRNWPAFQLDDDGKTPLERTRERMQQTGQWADWQMMGRRMAMGCVALEITQRCNLDCSYCYLSESSEALKDIPLEEVYRRIDLICRFYGPNTDVQVTGGDPTLRRREELLAIVAYIKARGMRASLFTNGIKASRELLAELCAVGLDDVAFHVDMTQGRSGYRSEAELNVLRAEYIERARGLPLSVLFNTTVFPGNFAQVPDLVKFFIGYTDVVRLVSFQAGADTGRGAKRARVALTADSVIEAINQGAGTRLNFNAASAGHASCNGYAYGLVINGRVRDFFNDPAFVQELMHQTAHLTFERANKRRTVQAMVGFLLTHPRLLWGFLRRSAKTAWQARTDLLKARGKVGKLSYFVHNFMDAKALERQRCEACSFMVMSGDGPISMCVHNAKRDDFLLQPSTLQRAGKILFFNPVSGALEDRMPNRIALVLTRKNARGRAKESFELTATEWKTAR